MNNQDLYVSLLHSLFRPYNCKVTCSLTHIGDIKVLT